MNYDTLELQLVILLWMTVKALLLEFFSFLFVILKRFDILDAQFFSQL